MMYKTRLTCGLLLALMWIGALNGMAQVKKFTFGPKVGFSSTSLTTSIDTLQNKFNQGFMGGLFFRFSGNVFYVQPEILFMTKGGVYESTTNQFKEEVFLKTLDVPVIFGLRIIPKESFNIRIHAGPSFSYMIDRDIKVNGENIGTALSESSIRDTYFGYQLGLGVDIVNFALDFRAEQGMGSVYTKPEGRPADEWKPLVINLSLALKLL